MTDELLKALGRVQRAQQAEREQVHASPNEDPLLRPLDEAEQANILDAVLGPAAAPVKQEQDANVLPLTRPPARRRWLAGVGSLAAAAALVLMFLPGDAARQSGLPLYSVVRASGEASVRGEPGDADVLRLRADTSIDWRVAPASPVSGEVGVRIVAAQGDELRWIPVGDAAQISADGVIRLRGRAGSWPALPPGAWTLTIVIGRPEALPADLDAYRSGVDRAHSLGWQLQQVKVQIEG